MGNAEEVALSPAGWMSGLELPLSLAGQEIWDHVLALEIPCLE